MRDVPDETINFNGEGKGETHLKWYPDVQKLG